MKVTIRPSITLEKHEHEKLMLAAKQELRTVSNLIKHIVKLFLQA